MPNLQLPNYLRSNRNRLGLSQRDVAFLLGVRYGAKISRYENFARISRLETALALEAIYKRTVSELFGGLYQKAERQVAKRAKTLLKSKYCRQAGQSVRRRDSLIQLAEI